MVIIRAAFFLIMNITGKLRQKSEFFRVAPDKLAACLLGKLIVYTNENETLSAVITETEAYLSAGDQASHSAPGLTKRNAPMFEDGGTIYVYKIYGIHHCFNIVSQTKGIGSAVLIRAAEPVGGIENMKANRNTEYIENLCRGPGNFCRAFGFDLSHNNLNCFCDNIGIYGHIPEGSFSIGNTERIGITKSAGLKLRFFIRGSRFVSGKIGLNT